MEEEKNKPTKLEKFFKVLRTWEKCFYRVFFPYRKHGNLTKYNEGAYIFVGNHYSIWDVIYPCMVTDRPVHFMAKRELWKGGITKWLCNKAECIPVNRDGTDVQAVKTAMRVLKDGGIVNIFPEGTRNNSYDDFLPFKSGASALSIKMHAPIVPVVQIERVKLFHRIDVLYGDPFEFTEYYGKKLTDEDLEACDNKIRQVIKDMRNKFIEENNIKLKPLKQKKHKEAK